MKLRQTFARDLLHFRERDGFDDLLRIALGSALLGVWRKAEHAAAERARALAEAARVDDGDARLGRILMRYIDRMTDPDDACDPLGKIVQAE